MYKADKFTNWISSLLAIKLNSPLEITMQDLPNRLTVYASRRNKKAHVFDSKDEQTKNTSVSFAARCSMSIPLFFTPQKEQGLNIYDGGVQNNYPVSILLDENPELEFIGLYLGSAVFERENEKTGIFSDLLSIWSETNDTENLKEYAKQTIIIDPRPISTLDFSLSELEKNYLLEIGKLAAKKYLRQNKKIKISDSDIKINETEILKMKTKVIRLRKRKRILKFISPPILMILLFLIYSYV